MSSSSDIEEVLGLLEKAAGEKEEELCSIKNAVQEGQEHVQGFIKHMQSEVEEHPWKVVGQVALYGFGIGLLLGARSGKKSEGSDS